MRRSGDYGDGAISRLLALLPQQAIVPLVFRPQVCSFPALTAVYVPAVTVVCPWLLRPQQVIAPALFSAQLWF